MKTNTFSHYINGKKVATFKDKSGMTLKQKIESRRRRAHSERLLKALSKMG